MELNILKVDLDIPRKDVAIKHLKERLSYLNDIDFMFIDLVDKIVLQKKTSYGVKILLKEDMSTPKDIILLQLLLGSDYMKEANTIINHYKFKMQYSNRLFDCKRYKGGKLKIAKKFDITEEIMNYVNSKKRKKFFN